jgi:NAD(P)-dependent dehydrogenase (short-subunit alcohol dehydrogenase family)
MQSGRAEQVAIVTGAASGIGRASAFALAARGARIVVSDVAEEGGAETVAAIEAEGGRAVFQRCDVSVETEVEALVERAVSQFGRLDWAHNNAGIGGPPGTMADYDTETWSRVLAVNLNGVFFCMKHEIPRMLEVGGGAIVNTSSTFGMVGVPGLPAYVASKHGIAGVTRAAALEYAKAGIRVNAVCPGPTLTPTVEEFFAMVGPEDPKAVEEQFAAGGPIGRMGQPGEIGPAVAWLCSEEASFVTGLVMPVDGGWTAQ